MNRPVCIVGSNSPTLRERLIDRYTSPELCELLDIPIEDFIDAFYDQCWHNREVLEDVQAITKQTESSEDQDEELHY